LEQIASTGVLAVDLSWLNNNYQRLLANYVKRGKAHQLREVNPSHRWAAVTFFLWQTYQDTIDQILDIRCQAD
jgi:GH25 family lysozyme M1 (1,4-beta-N-acetylmuramidase)